MASLYLARRRGAAGFRKLVAIKVVRQGLSESSAMIRMFVNEARITAHVAHPNVVHVEELGESAGLFYLVMEYVHGCSLSQLARALAKKNRRLSARAAVAITMRIAEGLGAVHEARDEQGRPLSIVHRDVSPQNVLLSVQGHVKLIDFGVAKASLGEAEDEQESGEIKGKIAYMAPEQAHAAPVDARIDQYALGVILWELLAGRRLFAGSDEIELLRQVREPQVVRPSVYAPGISSSLEDVVMRALSPERDARYGSVRELRRALASALPEAVAVDSDALADLVRTTVGDELERVMKELPEEATRVLAGPASAPAVRHSVEEVLATMTSPASSPAADRGSQDRSGQRAAERSAQRSAVPSPLPPSERRGWGWQAALAVAAIGVGVALGSWVARGGDEAAAMPVVPEPLEQPPEPRVAEVPAPTPTPVGVLPVSVTTSSVTTSSVSVAPPAPGAIPAEPVVAVDEETPSESRAQRSRRMRRRRAAQAAAGQREPSVVHGTPLLTDLP